MQKVLLYTTILSLIFGFVVSSKVAPRIPTSSKYADFTLGEGTNGPLYLNGTLDATTGNYKFLLSSETSYAVVMDTACTNCDVTHKYAETATGAAGPSLLLHTQVANTDSTQLSVSNVTTQLNDVTLTTGGTNPWKLNLTIVKSANVSFSIKEGDGYFGIAPSQYNSTPQGTGTNESILFALREQGLIEHEIVQIYDNKMRIGSWNPQLLERGASLNVVQSTKINEYNFDIQDILIGGREALFAPGGFAYTKLVKISLDLPYLYVGQEDWVLITNSFKQIAPSLECDQDKNYCRFNFGCGQILNPSGQTMDLILLDAYTQYGKRTAPISNPIEDIFVDGSQFGMESGKYCYLPIFQHLMDTTADKTYENQMWVGRQFLKNDVIVFDNTPYYEQEVFQYPQIGIGKKRATTQNFLEKQEDLDSNKPLYIIQ